MKKIDLFKGCYRKKKTVCVFVCVCVCVCVCLVCVCVGGGGGGGGGSGVFDSTVSFIPTNHEIKCTVSPIKTKLSANNTTYVTQFVCQPPGTLGLEFSLL